MYKWFEIWFSDKVIVLEIMIKNMSADLAAGYSYFGNSIVSQRKEIDEYKRKFDEQVEKLKEMDPKQAEHWCYLDLKKRGAI